MHKPTRKLVLFYLLLTIVGLVATEESVPVTAETSDNSVPTSDVLEESVPESKFAKTDATSAGVSGGTWGTGTVTTSPVSVRGEAGRLSEQQHQDQRREAIDETTTSSPETAVDHQPTTTTISNSSSSSSSSSENSQQCSQQSQLPDKRQTFYHLVVLVHGYLGSDREQAYLGEAIMERSNPILKNRASSTQGKLHGEHTFVVLSSQANKGNTTDGIVNGGKRLAAEVRQWIHEHSSRLSKQQLQAAEETNNQQQEPTIMTLSFIGNSLGGLYSRYALAELQDTFLGNDEEDKGNFAILLVLPLVFATTSSPHLGVTQETFIKLPRWLETSVVARLMEETGHDLFRVAPFKKNPTKEEEEEEGGVIMDMCHHAKPDRKNKKDFLKPLGQFQKRLAVANAYNTDFLVSVSSGAFLCKDSDSAHFTITDENHGIRLLDNEYAILQVTTAPQPVISSTTNSLRGCVESLDRLGWQKIFMDTRGALPAWSRLSTPDVIASKEHNIPEGPRTSYSSRELVQQFSRFGTLLPIAHPLNIANAKTDLYSELTKLGRPIMDALADLLVNDMIELSEQYWASTNNGTSSQNEPNVCQAVAS